MGSCQMRVWTQRLCLTGLRCSGTLKTMLSTASSSSTTESQSFRAVNMSIGGLQVEHGFAVEKGQEVMQYLAPFGFMRNEDETEIDQSYRGKRIHDIVALVYKQNTGRISTTEDFCSNCGYPDLVDCRMSDHNMLAAKYDMTLTAGNFFYTTYTDASDDSLCYLSKCTCTPFPYPVPGINDMPWCSC